MRAALAATVAEDAASVEVTLDYTVRAPAGTTRVPLAVALVPDASVAVEEATSPAGTVGVDLADGRERWTGWLRLAQPLAAAGELPFQIRYRVFQRGGPRIEVPVVVVTWPPVEPRAAPFTADVLVPAGVAVSEPFPSGLERVGGGDGPQRYHAELPAVPELLGFQVPSGDDAPWLTLRTALNGAAVALALAFSAAGWRYLRRLPRP
ncbi:MAG: hypothetical protein IRZ00_05460 [Gemmatimonadetes bacterium]|nr:hypothetical protein [Gemmatimonadota bacterium]